MCNLVKTNLANKEGLYVNAQGILVQSSLQTANQFKIAHAELLKTIRRQIKIATRKNLVLSAMFIEAKYKAEHNQLYNCYEITEAGLGFISSKVKTDEALAAQLILCSKFHEVKKIIYDEKVNLMLERNLWTVKWWIAKTDTAEIYKIKGLDNRIGRLCAKLYREKYDGKEPERAKDSNYPKGVGLYEPEQLRVAFQELYWNPMIKAMMDKKDEEFLL